MITDIFSHGNIIEGLIYFLISMLCVLVSITFHEYAHAFSAYKLGDPTAKNMGRMSLDPTKHIDLYGFICFLICGWGWAKPVTVNINNLKNKRRDDLIISFAGPLANLILSFIFFALYVFIGTYVTLNNYVVLDILASLSITNMGFALFNLIPVYPLDGYHIFTSLFPKLGFKSSYFMLRYGMWILIALSFSGLLDMILGPISDTLFKLFGLICNLFI